MQLAQGIRRHGFRKWYERRLIDAHVHVTAVRANLTEQVGVSISGKRIGVTLRSDNGTPGNTLDDRSVSGFLGNKLKLDAPATGTGVATISGKDSMKIQGNILDEKGRRHRVFDGAEAALRGNPTRAGDGTVLLPAYEGRYLGIFVVVLGLRAADSALYHAKKHNRGKYSIAKGATGRLNPIQVKDAP